ncbi:MAG: SDR family NAD(P)-dependent oxidoreductase [Bacteroidales bacterium]|nr:SDR family NAD(P)-dependent oxidoreductase [Bacteroidales bacterium]
MIDFRSKTVLVTGASSGIGAALAARFAKAGANLLLAARSMDKLESVAQSCRALGVQAKPYKVDFSDMASVDAFAAQLLSEGCQIDCLVLNAGISQRSTAFETDMEVDRKVMETNFWGPVRLVKQLASILKGEHPVSIAVTTSISGLFGFPLRSAYCSSKHALFGFFEALDLENKNIKVTFLIPGRINTPISKSALLGDGSTYAKMDQGQAGGMDVDKCADIAYKAIARGRHRRLIGGKELLMAHFKRWCPPLFWLLAGKVSAT